jgi:beta-phosphoglucomutase-like phosphatase (HAD superfamily)
MSGLFFDLDGTLVDSDAYHFAAFRVAVADFTARIFDLIEKRALDPRRSLTGENA